MSFFVHYQYVRKKLKNCEFTAHTVYTIPICVLLLHIQLKYYVNGIYDTLLFL